MDLGGMVGTFINCMKIDPNNCGDMLEENEDLASLAEMKFVRESVAREAVMEVMNSKRKFDEKIVEALTDEKMSFNEKVTQNCDGESPKTTKKPGPNEDSSIS